MKTIIVPIDFSDCSVEALKVAADISRITGAQLTLMHWYYRPYHASLSPIFSTVNTQIDSKQNEAYKDQFKGNIAELVKQDFMKDISHRELLIFDKSVSEVFEMDEVSKADLIVMGTTGAGNIKEITVGSNTQKAVRNANPPTLAVKKYFDVKKIKDMIYASDFKEEEGTEAFSKIYKLIDSMKVKLHLLKIITPTYFEDTDASKVKIDMFAKKAKIDDYTESIYNNYSPEEGITEYADKFENSLICIATHGYKGLGHFLNGSISEDLVNRLDRPILSVKK